MYLHNNKKEISKCVIIKPNFSWYTMGQRTKRESPAFPPVAYRHGGVWNYNGLDGTWASPTPFWPASPQALAWCDPSRCHCQPWVRGLIHSLGECCVLFTPAENATVQTCFLSKSCLENVLHVSSPGILWVAYPKGLPWRHQECLPRVQTGLREHLETTRSISVTLAIAANNCDMSRYLDFSPQSSQSVWFYREAPNYRVHRLCGHLMRNKYLFELIL